MLKGIPNTHAPTKQATKKQQIKNKAHHEINEQKNDEKDAMKLDADAEESEDEDEDVDVDMDDSDMEADDDDDDDEVPLPIDSEDEAELEAQRIRFNDLLAAKAASSQLSSLSEIKERGGNFKCANGGSVAATTTTITNSVSKNSNCAFMALSTKNENNRTIEKEITKTKTEELPQKLSVNVKSLNKSKVNQQKPLKTQNPIYQNGKKEAPALSKVSQPLPPPPAKKRRGRPPLHKRKRIHSSTSPSSTCSSVIAVTPAQNRSKNLELCAEVYVSEQCYAFACMLCGLNYLTLKGLTEHIVKEHNFNEKPFKKNGRKKTVSTPPSSSSPDVTIKHETITMDRTKLVCCAKIFALNRKTITLTCAQCDTKFKGVKEFRKLDQHLRARHKVFNEESKLITQIKIEMNPSVNDYLNRSTLVMVSIPSDASDMLTSEDSLPETSKKATQVDSNKEKRQPMILVARKDQESKMEKKIVVIEKVAKETTTKIPKAPSGVTKDHFLVMKTNGGGASTSASTQKTEEAIIVQRKPRGRPKKDKLSKQGTTIPKAKKSTDIIPRKRGRKPKTVDTTKIAAAITSTLVSSTALLSTNESPKASTSQDIKEESLDEDGGNAKTSSSLLSSSTQVQVQVQVAKSINESTSDTTKTPQRPMRKSKAQVIDYAVDVKDEDEDEMDERLKEQNAAATSSEYSPSSNSNDESSIKENAEKCEKSDDELVNSNESTKMLLISRGTSSDGKTVYICNICTKSLNKMSRMLDHQRLHTGEKPYTCTICGKSFRLKVRMREHILRHRTEKAFKCEICNLPIATKQDLTLHMRHHKSDRRHKCSVCNKGFVRSSDLNIHVRIHTGEKPFNCDICGKAFRARQNLVVHRRSHVGDKPVKCELCEKRFSRKIDLRVHMRKHTGEKPYICDICKRGYSSRFNLQCHIDREHLKGEPKKKPGRKSVSLKEKISEQNKLIKELTKRLVSKNTKYMPQDEDDDVSIDDNADDDDDDLDHDDNDVDNNKEKKDATILNGNNTNEVAAMSLTVNNDHGHHDEVGDGNGDSDCIANGVNVSVSNNIIQQVSVTVSMQVEKVKQINGDSDKVNLRNNDNDGHHQLAVKPEKENENTMVSSLVAGSPTALNDKTKASNRKINSYFTVVGQQAEI